MESSTFSTKPWYLYTEDDDAHLYDQDFDLEALLCPTAAQKPVETQLVPPNIQDSSNPEERSLNQEPTPLENNALVNALYKELERTRAQLEHQIQRNFVLECKVKAEEQMGKEKALEFTATLEQKDKEIQDLVTGLEELRCQYNCKVLENVQLKQELVISKKIIKNMNDKDLEVQNLTAALQKKDKKLKDQENAYKEIRYLHNSKIQEHVQLRQEFVDSKKHTEKANERDLGLHKLIHTLQEKNKQLQKEIQAHQEFRCRYNSKVLENVQLKQELVTSKKTMQKMKEKNMQLQNLSAALQKTEKQLLNQVDANMALQSLYNSQLEEQVELKQELADTSKAYEELKEKLRELITVTPTTHHNVKTQFTKVQEVSYELSSVREELSFLEITSITLSTHY